MSPHAKSRKDAPGTPPTSRSYQIGYGKPPEHSRFQPGQSGNLRGRPKGALNKARGPTGDKLRAILLAEADRAVTVNEGGRPVTISMMEAVVRGLAVSAAKGDYRSARLWMDSVASAEKADKDKHYAYLEAVIDYKREGEDKIAYCRTHGLLEPELVPHPADIIIDLHNATASFIGPMTKEQKREWDAIAAIRTRCEENIAVLQAALTENPKRKDRADMVEQIEDQQRRIKMVSNVIGSWPKPPPAGSLAFMPAKVRV